MPIDRERRDRSARAIVAALRGQISLEDAARRVTKARHRAPAIPDEAIAAADATLVAICNDRTRGEEAWDRLLRTIALLLSDCEVQERVRLLVPWRSLVAFGLICGAALLGWYVLAPAHWAAIAVAWLAPIAGAALLYRAKRKEERATRQRSAPFAPFAHEDNWRAAEPLLAPLGLPPFDPARLKLPPMRRGCGCVYHRNSDSETGWLSKAVAILVVVLLTPLLSWLLTAVFLCFAAVSPVVAITLMLPTRYQVWRRLSAAPT